jgi:hypothetical protein
MAKGVVDRSHGTESTGVPTTTLDLEETHVFEMAQGSDDRREGLMGAEIVDPLSLDLPGGRRLMPNGPDAAVRKIADLIEAGDVHTGQL